PVVALGYPIYVSIRAIETGSIYDMRKVVSYWIIFSFIYLLEHVFELLPEWVPLWSYLRLIFICWLVIPQLNGAFYLYQNLIHPHLQFKLPCAVTQFYVTCSEWFIKLNKVSSMKKDTFLAVAESYLEENGSVPLAKLIASKPECNEGGLILGEMECTTKCDAAESIQVGSIAENVLQIEKEASSAAIQVISKPAIPAIAKLPDTSSLQVFQTSWTCEICNVTVSSELTLLLHLRGKRHMAESKLWCAFCNLRCSSEIDMISHLKGKRQLAKLRKTLANAGAS
ncbi:hypothetical protein HAX54_052201, partial [Datura stramonium]|nr:hypothetical protein [Datura stramonium]